MRYCSCCGAAFYPRRHYYHQCTSCWRPDGTDDAATRELVLRAWRQGYEAGTAAVAVDRRCGAAVDGALLLAVIKLTHPDKHPPERFGEANAVTARLLELRDAVGVTS